MSDNPLQMDSSPFEELSGRLLYSGRSMRGTFHDGDLLFIVPVALSQISRGDVVIYKRSTQGTGQSALVAHRVTGLVAGGAILRGDGNSRCDVDTVFEQDLLGRVSYYERNGKVRPVANGPRGLARARLLHLWYGGRRTLWRSVTFVGRIPYRWFKRSGIVRYVWQIPIERILLQTPDGPLIKYVHRGRTVAQWWPETGKMIYVRPYDLVIPRPDDATHTNDQTPNANSRANIPVAGPKSE
jgi:signal peptidase I